MIISNKRRRMIINIFLKTFNVSQTSFDVFKKGCFFNSKSFLQSYVCLEKLQFLFEKVSGQVLSFAFLSGIYFSAWLRFQDFSLYSSCSIFTKTFTIYIYVMLLKYMPEKIFSFFDCNIGNKWN